MAISWTSVATIIFQCLNLRGLILALFLHQKNSTPTTSRQKKTSSPRHNQKMCFVRLVLKMYKLTMKLHQKNDRHTMRSKAYHSRHEFRYLAMSMKISRLASVLIKDSMDPMVYHPITNHPKMGDSNRDVHLFPICSADTSKIVPCKTVTKGFTRGALISALSRTSTVAVVNS